MRDPEIRQLFNPCGVDTNRFLRSIGIDPRNPLMDRKYYYWHPWMPGTERISRNQRVLARRNQAKSTHWKPLRKHRYIVPQKVWKKTYPRNMRCGNSDEGGEE